MADMWYYYQNGKRGGPLSESALLQLLQDGQLSWNDLVWRDGLEGWTPAEKVPALVALRAPEEPAAPAPPPFVIPAIPPEQAATPAPVAEAAPVAATAPAPVAPAPVAPAPVAPAPAPMPAFHAAPAPIPVSPEPAPFLAGETVSQRAVLALSQTRPWVRLISILVYIGAAFLIIGGIAALVTSIMGGVSGGASTGPMALGIGLGIAVFFIYLIAAVLIFPVGLFLGRYASQIKSLKRTGHLEALENALFAQKSFWKYVGVLSLINLIIQILAIAGLLIFGLGTFMSRGGVEGQSWERGASGLRRGRRASRPTRGGDGCRARGPLTQRSKDACAPGARPSLPAYLALLSANKETSGSPPRISALRRVLMKRLHDPKFLLAAVVLSAASAAIALAQAGAGPGAERPDSEIQAPSWFPNVLAPYQAQAVPPLRLENSPRLDALIHEGKLQLTVSDALALALENNLDIAVQRFVPQIAETDVLRTSSGQAARGFSGASVPSGLSAGAIGVGVSAAGGGGGLGSAGGITGGGGAISIGSSGNFDPSVSFNFSWDRVTSPLNTIQVAGIPVVTANATALSSNYAQMFHTGTSYFLTMTGQRQGSTQQKLRFNPAVVSRFSLGFNQPLLSGFGLQANERFIRVAKNNLDVSDEVFRQQVIATVVQVENAYWDLAAFQRNVKVAEQSLAVAERLLSDNRSRVEIGAMPPLEVTAAEAEVAARTRDLTLAQTNLQFQEVVLKNLLVRKPSPALDAARIQLTDSMPEPKPADLPELGKALEDAFKNRPDLRVAESSLENQQIAIAFTRNSLMPAAAVFGLYAGSGLDGNTLETRAGAGNSLRQSLAGDFPEYGAGVSLSLPILNRVAQADNVRSQLEEKQLQLGMQRSRNQVALEVQKAVIGLVQGKAQLEAAREAARLARDIWEGEQERLEAGVSTSYQVILRERDFVGAQQAEVDAGVNYVKALVELDRATGTTLDRRRILLGDALSGDVTQPPVAAGYMTPGTQGK